MGLLMRSRIGEVLVMVGLRCEHVHIRAETRTCLTFFGEITDSIAAEFLEIARKYFEQDEYLRELAERKERE